MVYEFGVTNAQNKSIVHSEVTMDDLFDAEVKPIKQTKCHVRPHVGHGTIVYINQLWLTIYSIPFNLIEV